MQDHYVTKTIVRQLVKHKALHTTSTCLKKIKKQFHAYILPYRQKQQNLKYFLKQQ